MTTDTLTARNGTHPEHGVREGTLTPSHVHDLDGHLLAAVREGATRATVGAGLLGVAIVHAVDGVAKWSETRYIFWMYMAAIVAAVAVAGWTVFTRSSVALLAAAGVAGSVLVGFLLNRTVGMPNATGDIGNWTEPLGLTSMFVETATVLVATGAYLVSGRGARR